MQVMQVFKCQKPFNDVWARIVRLKTVGHCCKAALPDSSTVAFLLSLLVETEPLRVNLSNLRHLIRVVAKYRTKTT